MCAGKHCVEVCALQIIDIDLIELQWNSRFAALVVSKSLTWNQTKTIRFK